MTKDYLSLEEAEVVQTMRDNGYSNKEIAFALVAREDSELVDRVLAYIEKVEG